MTAASPLARAIRAVQACRRKVPGLAEEEAWRNWLERTAGKRSLRAMTGAELGRVLDALHRAGAPRGPRGDSYHGKQARMIRAMWIALADRGVVRDRSDRALDRFARRVLGREEDAPESVRWLTDPALAGKVIEALKAMGRRAENVEAEARDG